MMCLILSLRETNQNMVFEKKLTKTYIFMPNTKITTIFLGPDNGKKGKKENKLIKKLFFLLDESSELRMDVIS